MNRQLQKTGVRQWFGDDFINLQDELYTALEGFLSPFGNFIISGCQVSGNTISQGLLFINGRICRFNGASNAFFPYYLKLSQTESDNRLYQDGISKPTIKRYFAEFSVQKPEVSHITINPTGNITFREALQAAGYRFSDRLHITPPNSLVNPTIGDLTIFDDTIYIARLGDEGTEYKPIIAKNAELFRNKLVNEFLTFETSWREPNFNQGFSGNLKYRGINGFLYFFGTLNAINPTSDIAFHLPEDLCPLSEIVIFAHDYQDNSRQIKISSSGDFRLINSGTFSSILFNTVIPTDIE